MGNTLGVKEKKHKKQSHNKESCYTQIGYLARPENVFRAKYNKVIRNMRQRFKLKAASSTVSISNVKSASAAHKTITGVPFVKSSTVYTTSSSSSKSFDSLSHISCKLSIVPKPQLRINDMATTLSYSKVDLFDLRDPSVAHKPIQPTHFMSGNTQETKTSVLSANSSQQSTERNTFESLNRNESITRGEKCASVQIITSAPLSPSSCKPNIPPSPRPTLSIKSTPLCSYNMATALSDSKDALFDLRDPPVTHKPVQPTQVMSEKTQEAKTRVLSANSSQIQSTERNTFESLNRNESITRGVKCASVQIITSAPLSPSSCQPNIPAGPPLSIKSTPLCSYNMAMALSDSKDALSDFRDPPVTHKPVQPTQVMSEKTQEAKTRVLSANSSQIQSTERNTFKSLSRNEYINRGLKNPTSQIITCKPNIAPRQLLSNKSPPLSSYDMATTLSESKVALSDISDPVTHKPIQTTQVTSEKTPSVNWSEIQSKEKSSRNETISTCIKSPSVLSSAISCNPCLLVKPELGSIAPPSSPIKTQAITNSFEPEPTSSNSNSYMEWILNDDWSSEDSICINNEDEPIGVFVFTNSQYAKSTRKDQCNKESKFVLKMYNPSRAIRMMFQNNFKCVNKSKSNTNYLVKLNQVLKSKPNSLTQHNYLEALKLYADIEDLHCEEAIRVYNRKSEKIVSIGKAKNYKIFVPNLIDSRPSIAVCCRLTINTSELQIYGTISEIQPDYIVVEFERSFDTNIRYDVNFLSNRITFRMEKMAIDLMRQKKLVPFMFPDKAKIQESNINHTEHTFTWFNKSVATNPEQQIAIENIYRGTSYPYPYILFGPPGTGKTTTLVESILQLWHNKADTNILIVSTSNYACNVISKRLLEFLPSSEVYRLFSKSQEIVVDKIDPDVLNVSNLKSKTYYSPKPSELYPYRIIIATPTASGRLVMNRFDCEHFTHLFVDECASCTEGSTLIPIAGLISSLKTINANIVLAGDPLQLRPVIYSKYADNLGYSVSMIERLMKFSLYEKDEYTGEYNNKFITKLRLNYRSHKDILHISNQLFYNNELEAHGSKHVTDWVINWKHLPNPKFPIIFDAVFGESLADGDSPSLYNQHEIEMVISYLKLLVNRKINGKMVRPSDIGVISPYRKQNQKIRKQCYGKWSDVEVATVEAFQGSEKSVIILSTVRSNIDTMGFLSNERRLNVALTRAQGILIIVGDPKVLMMDNCWYQLLKFCYDNNAICGEPFNFYE